MGENTKIEWATHTMNFWMGCTKVSPACDHCYAEDMMATRYGRVAWGAGEDRVRTSATNWKEPFKWDRKARADGKIETVFCLSLGDIWDNEVDPMWRRDAFSVMERTPNLLYLLLSKRIGNAIKMCDPLAANPPLPRNAALGATMVNQDEWDRDAPKLKEAAEVLGARLTFASVEPMLGPIRMAGHYPDWVICGGESGKHARPMHPDWVRSLRDQCAITATPFFLKQWGEWVPSASLTIEERASLPAVSVLRDGQVREWHLEFPDARLVGDGMVSMSRVGKKAAGALLDGREYREFPADQAPSNPAMEIVRQTAASLTRGMR